VHAIGDVTDRNSATLNESCRSVSVWRVASILEVSRLLLRDNERVLSKISQAHY